MARIGIDTENDGTSALALMAENFATPGPAAREQVKRTNVRTTIGSILFVKLPRSAEERDELSPEGREVCLALGRDSSESELLSILISETQRCLTAANLVAAPHKSLMRDPPILPLAALNPIPPRPDLPELFDIRSRERMTKPQIEHELKAQQVRQVCEAVRQQMALLAKTRNGLAIVLTHSHIIEGALAALVQPTHTQQQPDEIAGMFMHGESWCLELTEDSEAPQTPLGLRIRHGKKEYGVNPKGKEMLLGEVE